MRAPLIGILLIISLILASSQVNCTPYTISVTAGVSVGSEVAAQAHVNLTVLDLPQPVSLSQAKSCPDNTLVRVDSLIASTSSEHFAGLFYAQQEDRVGGIGIIWDGPIACGDHVWALGGITTINGERFIDAIVVECDES